jgi:hypothetical protein
MTETASSNKLNWLLTIISLAATIGLLVVSPEWFWVGLPFVTTYFVKAMNWM